MSAGVVMSYHPRIHNASNDRELTTSPFTCRVAGGSGATTTTTIPVSETSLPVACKPVQIHPNGQEEKEPNNSIHRRETVTIEEASHPPPPPPPRSTRPAKRTSSTLSFSSSDSSTDEDAVGAKLLMSGAKQPSPHHTARMLEELFSSESSDSEENTETVLSEVLKDPLESSMEGIEDLATGILRTGRLSVQGEAGDMSKLQPMLLGLQASEREIAQLLPQLMQVPFFAQVDTEHSHGWIWSRQGLIPEDFLAYGHIRLGLPIDTAIYSLLRRHCAKGARQAEAVIQLSQTVDYVKSLGENIPALICSATVLSSPSPPLPEVFFEVKVKEGEEESPSPTSKGQKVSHDSGVMSEKNIPIDPNHLQLPSKSTKASEKRGLQKTLRDTSDSSLVSPTVSNNTSSVSLFSSSSSLPMVHSLSVDTGGDRMKTIVENGSSNSLSPGGAPGQQRIRKTSLYRKPSFSGSENSDDGASNAGCCSPSSRLLFDRNQWTTTIQDNNTVVGMYGDTTYPMLTWNPKLRLDFEISSRTGTPGMVVAIDTETPALNFKLHNPTPHRVGFSIRAYRQTSVYSSHVIYPQNGLHMLEQAQCWEENADVYQDTPDRNEYLIVELFFATLEGNRPSWNVIRKYAVMKANKRRQNNPRPSRGNSHFQMPGAPDKKQDNLKQVIAHGLQCVVKNKHSTAEIIFTQALFLPDFQRIELKAFVYICLAVVAYRRQKAGEIDSLIHSMNLVNSVDKLIEACEAPRTIRMPRTVQLVKQLRKELNFSDIVKNMRRKDRPKPSRLVSNYSTEGSSTIMCEEGGFLSHKATTLLVPHGALSSTTEVTLSSHDHQQLQAMLASTGWEKTVSIVCAIHIQCETSAGRFRQPVQIRTVLPENGRLTQNLSLATSPLILLHSNYLRKWDDITSDPATSLSLTDAGISLSTDHTGWLAVAAVDLDRARVASMAMQALSISPAVLRVSVFGQQFTDDVMQIMVSMAPTKDGDSGSGEEEKDKPSVVVAEKGVNMEHTKLSFPYLIQAYPGEQLRCRLSGSFEPDSESGETDLDFSFKATHTHECLSGKFVRLTMPAEKIRGGKLVISRRVGVNSSSSNCCPAATAEEWENIADVSIHFSPSSTSTSSSAAASTRNSRR